MSRKAFLGASRALTDFIVSSPDLAGNDIIPFQSTDPLAPVADDALRRAMGVATDVSDVAVDWPAPGIQSSPEAGRCVFPGCERKAAADGEFCAECSLLGDQLG